MVARLLLERKDSHHTQRWIHDEPERPEWDLACLRSRVLRDCSIEPADIAIEVPDEPQAGHAVLGAAIRLVGGIDADSKEAGAAVVKKSAVRDCGCNGLLSERARGRAKEAQDDVAPGGR